jgi:PRTRC genetic system protein F
VLFDPRTFDDGVLSDVPGWTPSRQHPAARRRSANGFLTLPTLPADIPAGGKLRHDEGLDGLETIQAQFEVGILAARDVKSAVSAGDAFAQAMFAWLRRRTPSCKRLNFTFALLDQVAAREQVEQFGWEDNLEAPLYLAIELPCEQLYEIGERADVMRRAHPSLLYTAMDLVSTAASRSLFIRTPDELAEMFARWHWDYDARMSDEEGRAFLEERFGEGDSDIERYLPSNVLPLLAPDDVVPRCRRLDKRSRVRRLRRSELASLAVRTRGLPRRICRELINLQTVLARCSRYRILQTSQWAEPAYSAATIAMWSGHWVGEILDDHFECLSNAGDCTTYQVLIPVASQPKAIRQQFKELSCMFEIIAALDRVLTLISE